MISTILFYLFALLLLVISGYLTIFQNELIIWLKLKNKNSLHIYRYAFILCGVIGIILNILQLEMWLLIWLTLSVFLTVLLVGYILKELK